MPDIVMGSSHNTPHRDAPASDRGSVADFPGGHGGAGSPDNNLPLQLTSLVGREKEMAEVERLLLAQARLLTLTGPGGCGKTRLALAVAKDLLGDFEDGTWLVELAPLSDPDLVPQAVASVLDVREQPGRPLVETLSDVLGSRKTLLVLDNCEHLIEACAGLAEVLLRSCPNLRILATSREALGITGEVGWPVPPLSLPDPRRLPADVEGLSSYEAARLFVERARAVDPGFGLGAQNAVAVARVCYRLDGIPLAIELAAARAKVLTVEQIAGRLDESFGLLRGGSRIAMAHHRTLRATMEWSHELLDQEERVLFRRLSVFAGGFTLEAAEAVGQGEDLEKDEILDLLSRLVDKSLVLVRERDGEVRYRLLETVRQHGREKLQESGETGEVRGRHAVWFLRLAEDAEPHLKGHRQVAWLELLEREHGNLRAAMRWLLEEGALETAVQLAWALWFFWYLRGHQSEGRRYTGEILEKGDALPAGGTRAKVLCVRGAMSYGLLESIEQTKRLFEESVALFRQAGDTSGLAIALSGVSVTALQEGDMERATALLEEALTLYRETGNKWGVSSILSHLGIIPLNQGDHARAARYFEEALALSREVGDRLVGSISLYNLALEESRPQGDPERAAELYVEGLKLAVEIGNKVNAAYCLEGLGGLTAARGEPERAARLFGASEALLEAVGAPRHVHAQDRALYERAVEALRSRLGEEAFEAAWSEGRAMTPARAVEYALELPATPQKEPVATPQTSYPAGLSCRQVEVLRLVAKGLTNVQIAQELFISSRTVNGHLNSIYNKLGCNTRTEATLFAAEHDLLP